MFVSCFTHLAVSWLEWMVTNDDCVVVLGFWTLKHRRFCPSKVGKCFLRLDNLTFSNGFELDFFDFTFWQILISKRIENQTSFGCDFGLVFLEKIVLEMLERPSNFSFNHVDSLGEHHPVVWKFRAVLHFRFYQSSNNCRRSDCTHLRGSYFSASCKNWNLPSAIWKTKASSTFSKW